MVTSSINGELSMAIEVKTVFVCSCLNVELFGNLLSHFFSGAPSILARCTPAFWLMPCFLAT